MTNLPTVSVCLPVYNGQRYVGEAIDCVLRQTFTDFELVISDNASTDDTAVICRSAAVRDGRVRYHRGDVNRGLAANFNRACELSRGRYLVWICHDDIIAPDFLRRSIEALENDPGVVICYANGATIDEQGRELAPTSPVNSGASDFPSERLHRILFDDMCHPICGVMRMETLRKTRLHLPYADSDRVLLAEMGLRGRFALLPEPLFFRRLHEERVTTQFSDRWSRTLVFDPTKQGKVVYPWLSELRDFEIAIRRAPLSWKQRYLCRKQLYYWCLAWRKEILFDLRRGLQQTWTRGARKADRAATAIPAGGEPAEVA